MSDCRIIIKNKDIIDFLAKYNIGPEFESGASFIETVNDILVGKLVTYEFEGTTGTILVESVEYAVDREESFLVAAGRNPQTGEPDAAQTQIITKIEPYEPEEVEPEKIFEDPEPVTDDFIWNPIKIDPSSTTRNDTLSNTELKDDDTNISQRKLIEIVEEGRHQLIAVNNDGRLKGPRGVVLVAVPIKDLLKVNSQDDAIRLAELKTGLTIEEWQRDENNNRQVTEVTLTGGTYTVPVSSYFGTFSTGMFSERTTDTLQQAVDILIIQSRGKLTEQQAVYYLINQLQKLQDVRERAELGEVIPLQINQIGSASYPNGRIVLNKLSSMDISVGNLIATREGFKLLLELRGRKKLFEIIPSQYTEKEIKWMVDNFNNTSNPEVLKSYQLLLGRNKVPNKVIATDKGLLFIGEETRPATLDDLLTSLAKFPYRQRSLLLKDRFVYYLGNKYDSQRYLLETFVIPHGFWRQNGLITLDGANTAVLVSETSMDKVIDPYTALEQFIPTTNATEIPVYEGFVTPEGITLDKNTPGVYVPETDTIYYITTQALFEERVHATTAAFIRENPDDPQVIRLSEIYNEVKAFYEANNMQGRYPKAAYSFTKVEEFIARALTDKDTMQVIAAYDEKVKPAKSIITEFLDFLKRVFNLLSPTIGEVFEIYEYMRARPTNSYTLDPLFSQDITLDLSDSSDKLVYAQSMDYLFLQFIESQNVTLDAVRMAIAKDPKRSHDITGKFRRWLLEQPGYDLIKQTLDNYTVSKAIWLSYSSALAQEIDQTETEEQADADKDEFVKTDHEFKGGASNLLESSAISEVDNEVKAILSTIPDLENLNKLGIPTFFPYKGLYYEALDKVNGYTSLAELLETLKNSGGKFAEIERRINKESKLRQILLGKFYRSMNRYAVPFKILKRVNTKYFYIQITGENITRAEDMMNTNFYTKYGNLIGSDGAILPAYKLLLRNAIESNNFLEVAQLLGANVEAIKDTPEFEEWATAQTSETMKGRWIQSLSATLYQPTDLKSFVAKPFKELATIVAQVEKIRKIRMAKTPDGNPVAAESIPNSILEMVKLYRQLKRDEDGNLIIPDGIEYAFLRNPAFKYSYFKDYIETIEVIYHGGYNDKSTIDLEDPSWMFYSMFTMLTEGYAEFMRTETSSSSWAWRTLNYLPTNPRDLVPIYTNYLRMDIQGYISSLSGTEAYNAYKVKNPPGGPRELSGSPKLLIFENFNLPIRTQEDLDNLTDEQLQPFVMQFMQNLARQVSEEAQTLNVEAFFTEDVKSQLPANLDNINNIATVYALHDFIYHVEQTILFDGGIEYYKAYFKRAKGKVSTGNTTITDTDYWENMDPTQTMGGALPPELKVLNIEEPTQKYASGRFDGEVYIPGSPEFETIFQAQVDAAYRRKKMARIPVTRTDVMKEYLPKNNPYTNMKIGDGQGGINLDYLRAIQIGAGNWPDDAEATYQWERLYYKVNYLGQALSKTNTIQGMSEQAFYERGPQGVIPPVKYSYFGPSKELGHRPIFDKFSLFPMLPSMMKGTKMENLTRQMIENKVAYFKYPSGTKAVIANSGPGSVVSLDNLNISQSSAVLTLSPKFLKEQEKVSFKNKAESIFGSQSRKLIFQDSMEMGVWVDFELTDEEYSKLFPNGVSDRIAYFDTVSQYIKSLGNKIYERSNFARRYRDYVSLMRQSMRLQHKQALTSMGLREVKRSGVLVGYEISNPEEFADILKKYNIDNNPAITDYIAMLKEGNGLSYIEFSSMSSEIRKTIGSIFRKKIATQKVHGQPLIMVSSANLTSIDWQKPDPSDFDKYGATGLRYYQVKDGQTMAAQIKTSYGSEFDSFKNNEYIMSLPGNTIREKLNEMLNRKEAVDTNKIERLKDAGMPNARQLVEAEHRQALAFWEDHKESFTMFATRIPTQGLSSMDVFEIREFLPESAGKIVIPPLEIVAKAGSDFDIDKMYFYRPKLSKFTGKPLTDEQPVESVESIDEELRLIEIRLQVLLAEKKELQRNVKALRLQMKSATAQDQIREIKTQIRTSQLTESQKEELEELFTAKARLSGEREKITLAMGENKAVLQNKMLNVIKEQILDPLNYSNLTMPLGTGIIKGPLTQAAERYFGEGITDDKAGGENLTVKTHLLKRKSMLVAGKKLLGIAAVAVPGFQVQSKVRLQYNTFTDLSNNERNSLGPLAAPYNYNLLLTNEEKSYVVGGVVDASSMYSIDGTLKSEVLNQYVSAMVDAATENYAGFANHNFNTFPVAVFMVREGIPYQKIVDFMTSRVMRELEADPAIDALNLIAAKQDMIIFNILQVRTDINRSEAIGLYNSYLEQAIAQVKQDPSTQYTTFEKIDPRLIQPLQDIIILSQYYVFKKKASEAYHAQNMISVDTRPPKVIDDIIKIRRPTDKIMADTAQRAVDQTELSAFNTRQMFVDILTSFFPALYNYDTLTAFEKIETLLLEANRINLEQVDVLRLRLPNEWAAFLFKNTTLKSGKLGVAAMAYMKDAPKIYKAIKSDPVLSKTLFAKDLRIFKVGNQLYTFGLVRETKDEVVDKIYYQEMLSAYNNPQYTNLIKAVALVAMATTGYRKTFYSFTEIIPPSILSPVFEATRLEFLRAEQSSIVQAFQAYTFYNYEPVGPPAYKDGQIEYQPATEYAPEEIPLLREFVPGRLILNWEKIGPIIQEAKETHGSLEFRVPLDTEVRRGQKVTLKGENGTFVIHVTEVRRPSVAPGVKRAYSPYAYGPIADYTSLAVIGTLDSYEVYLPVTQAPTTPGSRLFKNAITSGGGGALGVDYLFDKGIREHGGVSIQYHLADDLEPPKYGNYPISDPVLIEEGRSKAIAASKTMWTNEGQPPGLKSLNDKKIIRDWFQVKFHDAVVAVSRIAKAGDIWSQDRNKENPRRVIADGVVQGGTGYAVEMAKNEGKPIYVFNDPTPDYPSNYPPGWYQWNHTTKQFDKIDRPPFLSNFAGIGTRYPSAIATKAVEDYIQQLLDEPIRELSLNETDYTKPLSFTLDGRQYESIAHAYYSNKDGAFNQWIYDNYSDSLISEIEKIMNLPITTSTDQSLPAVVPNLSDGRSLFDVWHLDIQGKRVLKVNQEVEIYIPLMEIQGEHGNMQDFLKMLAKDFPAPTLRESYAQFRKTNKILVKEEENGYVYFMHKGSEIEIPREFIEVKKKDKYSVAGSGNLRNNNLANAIYRERWKEHMIKNFGVFLELKKQAFNPGLARPTGPNTNESMLNTLFSVGLRLDGRDMQDILDDIVRAAMEQNPANVPSNTVITPTNTAAPLAKAMAPYTAPKSTTLNTYNKVTKTDLIITKFKPVDSVNIYYSTNQNKELSNLADRPFNVEFGNLGVKRFKTVEGAYQASKMLFSSQPVDLALLEQFQNATGAEAKSLGNQKTGRIKGLDTAKWDSNSEKVMYPLILASFQQNPDARKRLLQTGQATLTHTQDNTKWKEAFPRLLMNVRQELSKNTIVTTRSKDKFHFGNLASHLPKKKLGPQDLVPAVNIEQAVLNFIHWLTFMPVSPVGTDLIDQAKSVAKSNNLTITELNETPGEAAQIFLEGISTLGMTPQQSADYVRVWFKEKDRRQWIINQLRDGSLKSKQLVYFSDTQEIIHADALKYLIDNAESFYPTLNSKNFDNSVRSLQVGAVVKFKDQQYIVGNISEGKVILFLGDGTRYPSEVNSADLKIIGAYPVHSLEDRNYILYEDKIFNGLGEEVTDLEIIQNVKTSAKITASPVSQKETSKKLLDPNDKELKIGSVVDYKGERYLFAKENEGRAQLIDINFVKTPGTPSPKNITAIGSYPVVDYNGTDYIVVSRDMIFSTASKKRVFQSQPNIADQLYSRAKIRQESPNAYKAYRPLSNELPELANYKSAIDAMIPSYNEFLGLVTGYVTSGKDGTRQQFIGKETPQSFISALNWNLTRVSELYQTLKSQVNQIKTLEDSNQVEAGTYDSVVALGRVMKQIENIAKEDSDLICRL